jgi:hypothetical protein
MMGYLDRLNLRPAERRLVVLVAVVLFGVANLIFVWPYFGAWNLANLRLDKAEAKLASFQKEIAQTNTYNSRLAEFEKENPEVPLEDQALQFQRVIQTQSAQSGVNVNNFGRTATRTNDPFFLEQAQTISVATREKELVDFLYQLGAGTSLIRVRELSLRPDQQHYTLQGNITLVSSYQKKAPVKGASSAKSAATAARTAPGTPSATPVSPATAAVKPAGTNAPAKSGGVWTTVKGTVKGWFGGGSTPASAVSKTNVTAKPGATGVPTSLTNRVNPLRPTPVPPAQPPTSPKP